MRRHPALRFGSAAFKTDAPTDDDDADAKEALLVQVRAAAKETLTSDKLYKEFEKMNNEWKKFPLEAVRAFCDEKEGVLARFANMDAKFLELETRANNSGQKELTLRGQIEKWTTDNKDAIASIKAGTRRELPPMEIRAVASPMLPSNTYVTTTYLPPISWEAGVNDIPRAQPTFWDYLTKGATDSPAFGWVNKTNVQGAAGFIGPGVLKPNISFQLQTFISTYRKVAVTDKVAQELLWDIKGMETLIKDEIRYQILIACNTAVFSGTGSATSPTGITKLAVAYTLTTIKTKTPNYFDVLRAAVAQLRSGNLTGDITIVINPIDSANMDMTKASTAGTYLMPSFVTADGKTIAGATVIEDASMPVGSFFAGFLRYYKILIYKPLILTFGWENDDFTKNLITYLGELAFHQYFNTAYTGAFIYDTFALVLTAITAP
jgi:HK97 family phage major capsid protein